MCSNNNIRKILEIDDKIFKIIRSKYENIKILGILKIKTLLYFITL